MHLPWGNWLLHVFSRTRINPRAARLAGLRGTMAGRQVASLQSIFAICTRLIRQLVISDNRILGNISRACLIACFVKYDAMCRVFICLFIFFYALQARKATINLNSEVQSAIGWFPLWKRKSSGVAVSLTYFNRLWFALLLVGLKMYF